MLKASRQSNLDSFGMTHYEYFSFLFDEES